MFVFFVKYPFGKAASQVRYVLTCLVGFVCRTWQTVIPAVNFVGKAQ